MHIDDFYRYKMEHIDETESNMDNALFKQRKENVTKLMHENRPVYDELASLMNYLHSALHSQAIGLDKVKADFGVIDGSLDKLKITLSTHYEESQFCDEIVSRIADFVKKDDDTVDVERF